MELALRADGTEDPARDYAVGDIIRKAHVSIFPDFYYSTAVVLVFIARCYGRRRSAVTRALSIGYLLRSLYLLLDVGDGDLFRIPLPLSLQVIKAAEEFFELAFLSAYLVGIALSTSGRLPSGTNTADKRSPPPNRRTSLREAEWVTQGSGAETLIRSRRDKPRRMPMR